MVLQGASIFGGKGDEIMNKLQASMSSQGEIERLRAQCQALEEGKVAAEEARATAEARDKAAGEQLAAAVSLQKEAEVARHTAEAKVAELQAQVEKLTTSMPTPERTWQVEKKKIAIVLAASNKRAQAALAEEFPEVAEKFNIKDKGMQAALNALVVVKEGVPEAGPSGATATPQKL